MVFQTLSASKVRIVTKMCWNIMNIDDFSAQDGSENDPKLAQDHSKTIPKVIIFHVRFLLQFWSVLGSVWAPLWGPVGLQDRSNIGAKIDQQKRCKFKSEKVTSWSRLGALLGSTCGLRSFLHPLRPFLGRFLASCGAIYGLLGANFRFVGAVLVSLFSFGDPCSFATCPFAFERLPISRLSMSLVSLPFVVHRLSLFDLSIVLLVPGPCGLRAARLNKLYYP